MVREHILQQEEDTLFSKRTHYIVREHTSRRRQEGVENTFYGKETHYIVREHILWYENTFYSKRAHLKTSPKRCIRMFMQATDMLRCSGATHLVQGVGCRVQGLGLGLGLGYRHAAVLRCHAPGVGCRMQGVGCRAQSLGFGVQFRVQVIGLWVSGLGCRVRVYGLGFRVQLQRCSAATHLCAFCLQGENTFYLFYNDRTHSTTREHILW